MTEVQRKYVHKIRNSYKYIEFHTGIKVIEVILPKSPQGVWWMDYPLHYAESLYPNLEFDGKAYMMVIFKIDEYHHLSFQGLRSSIQVQHFGIKRKFKQTFEQYMLDLTNKATNNDPKLAWGLRNNDFIYFYL